jgi:enoyl-CoA hydratase/carnithine racemase
VTDDRRTDVATIDATDLVLCDVAEGVATLTLNRPERHNAWSVEMERQYFGLLDRCADDPEVRAIVVTGAGRSFCPGLDTQRLQEIAGEGQMSIQGRPPQHHALGVPKPIIAAINGACAGIGLVQALVCDVRFAARGARFTTAFARRGLVAEHGVSWLLPRLIGVERALDLLLSGRVFDADEAQALGVVSRVCEPGDLVVAATAYAREMARQCSPRSMAAIKDQVWQDLDVGLDAAVQRATLLMAWSASHPDLKEGVASFVDRRNPDFAPLPPGFQIEKEVPS